MDSCMVYAPVLITTLNRYDSLVRCLESLKANDWAKYTDVIIAIDKPVKKKHIKDNKRIIKYLNETSFNEFKTIRIVRRRRNLGAVGNFEKLVKECFVKYDRCICIFDDLELSPNFIEFMDRVLDQYENDSDIVGVSGYSYPIKWQIDEGYNVFKQNFVASIWGIGFWKCKYLKMFHSIHQRKLVSAYNGIYETGFDGMTDWAVKDYVSNLSHGISKKSFLTSITDISMRIYLAVDSKYFITPALSKIRNHGFDGSGEFCEMIVSGDALVFSGNYNYSGQPIDLDKHFYPKLDNSFNIEANRALLNSFDHVDHLALERIKADATIFYNRSPLNRFALDMNHYLYRIKRYIKRKITK